MTIYIGGKNIIGGFSSLEKEEFNNSIRSLNERINNLSTGSGVQGDSILDWYNAKNYGALGDGVTDDSDALQSLILEVYNAGGGTIYIPKGRYMLDKSLNWLSGVSLVGDGVGNSILATRYEGSTWQVTLSAITWNNKTDVEPYSLYGGNGGEGEKLPFENCHFRNFEIDGSGVVSTNNQYSVGIKGMFIQYMRNCTFKDMYIHDTIATGLGVDMLDKVIIDNVNCYNCGRGYGVMTGGSLGGAGIGIGTGGMHSENCIISNCQCEACGSNGIFVEHQALFDTGLSEYKAEGVLIHDCICKNNRYQGIGVRGGKGIKVSDNLVYGNTNGIYVNTLAADTVSITNNIVYDNTSIGIQVDGKNADNLTTKCIISGNAVENNPFKLNEYTKNCLVSNNKIIGSKVTINGNGHQVYNNIIDAGASDVLEEGLTIYGDYLEVIENTVMNTGKTTGNNKGAFAIGKGTANLKLTGLVFKNNIFIKNDPNVKSIPISQLGSNLQYIDCVLENNNFDFSSFGNNLTYSNSVIEGLTVRSGFIKPYYKYSYCHVELPSKVLDFTGATKLQIEFGVSRFSTKLYILSKYDVSNKKGWSIICQNGKVQLVSNVTGTEQVLTIDSSLNANTTTFYKIVYDGTTLKSYKSSDRKTYEEVTADNTNTINTDNIVANLSLSNDDICTIGCQYDGSNYNNRIYGNATNFDTIYAINIYKNDLLVTEHQYNFLNIGKTGIVLDSAQGYNGNIRGRLEQFEYTSYGTIS